MSNLEKTAEAAVTTLARKYLGPSYSYADRIPTPTECGVTDSGSLSALYTDISAFGTYTDTLAFGDTKMGFDGPKQRPLGMNFFIESGKCNKKSSDECKGKPRYLYIENIPTGKIACLDQLGIKLPATSIRGIVPGLIMDAVEINPVEIFSSLAGKGNSLSAPCERQTKPVGTYDDIRNGKTETQCTPKKDGLKCFPDFVERAFKETFVANKLNLMKSKHEKNYHKRKNLENLFLATLLIMILLFIYYKSY